MNAIVWKVIKPGRALPRMEFVPASGGGDSPGGERRVELARLASQEGNHAAAGSGAEEGVASQAEVCGGVGNNTGELTSPARPKKRGRPATIEGERKRRLLKILEAGQSRRYAAEKVGIDPATITRSMRRDPQFAAEVRAAESEGQRFLTIYDKLHNPRYAVMTLQPVISTPEIEREKEYLIAKGLPAERIRRLRQRQPGDRVLEPEEPPDRERPKTGVRVRPWKSGGGRKRSKETGDRGQHES